MKRSAGERYSAFGLDDLSGQDAVAHAGEIGLTRLVIVPDGVPTGSASPPRATQVGCWSTGDHQHAFVFQCHRRTPFQTRRVRFLPMCYDGKVVTLYWYNR
jgi:hypothetical protein